MRKQVAGNGTVGYDEAGRGTPAVLLHAFPLCRAMWRPQVDTLQDRWRLIAPDLRGFGETSGFDGPPSVDRMADDVAGLLDALGVSEPAVVGGLSMGGYVALAIARRHPARLRGLVLADTRAEPDTAEGKANRDKTMALAEARGSGAVLEQLLPKLLGRETHSRRPEVVEEVRRLASGQTADGVVGALRALRDRPDATPGLGGIAVPTLVLVGQDDHLTPVTTAETLANGIRGARLAIIERAGHLSNLEQPERFNEALRGFLQTVG